MQKLGDALGGQELENLLRATLSRVMGPDITFECRLCKEPMNEKTRDQVCLACLHKIKVKKYVPQKMSLLPEKYQNVDWRDYDDIGIMNGLRETLKSAYFHRQSVYQWGRAGNGKTTLHALFYRAFAKKLIEIRWVRSVEMMRLFRNALTVDGYVKELVATAKRGVLFIDDLGTEKSSGWVEEKLFSLIDSIYSNNGCVWITSNYSLKDLEDKYSPKITGRLAEICIETKNIDKDWRSAKRKANGKN